MCPFVEHVNTLQDERVATLSTLLRCFKCMRKLKLIVLIIDKIKIKCSPIVPKIVSDRNEDFYENKRENVYVSYHYYGVNKCDVEIRKKTDVYFFYENKPPQHYWYR